MPYTFKCPVCEFTSTKPKQGHASQGIHTHLRVIHGKKGNPIPIEVADAEPKHSDPVSAWTYKCSLCEFVPRVATGWKARAAVATHRKRIHGDKGSVVRVPLTPDILAEMESIRDDASPANGAPLPATRGRRGRADAVPGHVALDDLRFCPKCGLDLEHLARAFHKATV